MTRPAHYPEPIPCEVRTVRDSTARQARVDSPRNQSIKAGDSLRREQVCGYSSQRMLPR